MPRRSGAWRRSVAWRPRLADHFRCTSLGNRIFLMQDRGVSVSSNLALANPSWYITSDDINKIKPQSNTKKNEINNFIFWEHQMLGLINTSKYIKSKIAEYLTYNEILNFTSTCKQCFKIRTNPDFWSHVIQQHYNKQATVRTHQNIEQY